MGQHLNIRFDNEIEIDDYELDSVAIDNWIFANIEGRWNTRYGMLHTTYGFERVEDAILFMLEWGEHQMRQRSAK